MSYYEKIDILVNIAIAIITLGGVISTIVFTNKSVKKQIFNQNKQLYRPYIRIEKVDLISNNPVSKYIINELDGYYENISLGKNTNLKYTQDYVTLLFEIKNIGIGIANNIEIYNLRRENRIFWREYQTNKKSEYIEEYSPLSVVAVNESKEIRIAVKYIREEKFEVSDSCIFIIFYEDINKNLYSNEFHMQINYDDFEKKFKFSYHIMNSYDHKKEKYYQLKNKKSELNNFFILKGIKKDSKLKNKKSECVG